MSKASAFRNLSSAIGSTGLSMWSSPGCTAPDVCDGTSAVGESRHRIPGASIGQLARPPHTDPPDPEMSCQAALAAKICIADQLFSKSLC
jgi:hypothetical protein